MKRHFMISKSSVIVYILIVGLFTALTLIFIGVIFLKHLQVHPLFFIIIAILFVIYRILAIWEYYQHDKHISFEIDSDSYTCTYRNNRFDELLIFELSDIRQIIEHTDWLMAYYTIELQNSYKTIIFTCFMDDGFEDFLRGLRQGNNVQRIFHSERTLWIMLPD